jgi:arylsulfatase A-like enzyme
MPQTSEGLRARCQKRFGKRIKKADWKAAVRADCVRYNRLPTGEFITHRVLEHLKGSKAKREFLFVFFVDPHDPYGAPAWLEKKFLGDFKGKIRRKALWERNNDYPEDERFSIQAIYDAGIRYADIALGQLVDGLKAQGRWENTSLFVTADHGEGFGEHGFYLHAHHFWEEVIHVPLVAVGPRFTPQVDERLTQSLDVVATIAELAGASTEGLPGRSLLEPALAGRRIISEYNEFGIHRQAIMDGRYKVIWQRPADEEWYLRVAKKKEYFPSVSFDKEVIRVFDLQTDPQEKKDLAASMPEAAKAMLAELRAFVAGAQKTR